MRHIITLAALTPLCMAAWVSWEGHDDGLGLQQVWVEELRSIPIVPEVQQAQRSGLDADVTRLLSLVRPKAIQAAGGIIPTADALGGGLGRQGHVGNPQEEVVGENPYLEEATEFYGVEWAREALIIVRFRESSNIVWPCVVGDALERGPYQFKPSTWATTPYSHLDSCDLEAATYATAWKVSQPGGKEAWKSTWPR